MHEPADPIVQPTYAQVLHAILCVGEHCLIPLVTRKHIVDHVDVVWQPPKSNGVNSEHAREHKHVTQADYLPALEKSFEAKAHIVVQQLLRLA